jgi:hypothetical protein
LQAAAVVAFIKAAAAVQAACRYLVLNHCQLLIILALSAQVDLVRLVGLVH